MPPLVSVVLPVRDGGSWLAAAVDSILGQTLRDLELLVVDDHSRDAAAERLDRSDPRLQVIDSVGRGVSAAFNTGLARARGTFIARMDADDIALPDACSMASIVGPRPDHSAAISTTVRSRRSSTCRCVQDSDGASSRRPVV